jgi:hypothetical protein
MLTKLLGVNWENKVAAIVYSLTGLSMLANELGIVDTSVGKWMVKISVSAAFISGVYAHLKTKSSDVTGTGSGAVKGQNISHL